MFSFPYYIIMMVNLSEDSILSGCGFNWIAELKEQCFF